ncbi:MAG TPA: MerR family transcriptional regulator [Streptosporangiaceae bacterium]
MPSRTQDRARTRAVDIARTAGISVQQVRNYVDLGVLPPVERTPSGYRIFTADHAAAVVAVRSLAAGHGWARTRAIMRAVHAGDLDTALAELDAGHAELHHERTEIARVLAAVDDLAAAVPPPAAARRGALRVGEVARATGVRTSALRLWERHGLLRPARDTATGYRAYDPAEVRNARVVALLRRGGYPIPIVRAVLDELRTTGDPRRVRTELAARERDLVARSRNRLAASAALHTYLTHRAAPA